MLYLQAQQDLRALALRVRSRVSWIYWHALLQVVDHYRARRLQLTPMMLRVAGHWYFGLQTRVFDGWYGQARMVALCRKFQLVSSEALPLAIPPLPAAPLPRARRRETSEARDAATAAGDERDAA